MKKKSLILSGGNSSGGGSSSGDDYTCSSGGPGSTSCSTSAEFSGVATGCSVTCSSAYYACCNAYQNKCQCRSN
ncbi:MAG: hypothetical protein LBG28_15990 [Tannerella sp.]|nr:hypothetical protein [Tannerella sp.]